MTDVNSHGFFKYLAPVYDFGARMAMFGQYESLRQQLLSKIEIKKGRRILDMASGTGYLAEKMGAVDLVCTDISAAYVKTGQGQGERGFCAGRCSQAAI